MENIEQSTNIEKVDTKENIDYEKEYNSINEKHSILDNNYKALQEEFKSFKDNNSQSIESLNNEVIGYKKGIEEKDNYIIELEKRLFEIDKSNYIDTIIKQLNLYGYNPNKSMLLKEISYCKDLQEVNNHIATVMAIIGDDTLRKSSYIPPTKSNNNAVTNTWTSTINKVKNKLKHK